MDFKEDNSVPVPVPEFWDFVYGSWYVVDDDFATMWLMFCLASGSGSG